MESFKGFRRPVGHPGIRNHVILIANCSCAGGMIDQIAEAVPEAIPMRHAVGCSSPGEFDRWHMVLIGVCSNPNVYGAVIIGVGCETFNAREVAAEVRANTHKPTFGAIVQEDGGAEAVIEAGVQAARKMVSEARRCRREDFPVSELVVGTECGGSDALSGVMANPVIGEISDWVVKNRGTVLLSEVAEFIGTEHLLAARASSRELGERIISMVLHEEKEIRKNHGRRILANHCCREYGRRPFNDSGEGTWMYSKGRDISNRGTH